jgi:hypothetical protein
VWAERVGLGERVPQHEPRRERLEALNLLR